MKFLEWLAEKLQKSGYLPQHHTQDKRLKSYDNGCYMCPRCGHILDTNHAMKIVTEEEVAARRDAILKIKYKQTKPNNF